MQKRVAEHSPHGSTSVWQQVKQHILLIIILYENNKLHGLLKFRKSKLSDMCFLVDVLSMIISLYYDDSSKFSINKWYKCQPTL